MKEQKCITILSGIAAITSFTLSVILELVPLEFKVFELSLDFWENVCLGIFSGAFLSLVSGIRLYYVQRNEMLRSFWLSMEKYLQKINIFCLKHFPQDKNDMDVKISLEKSNSLIEEINELNNIYADQLERISHISFFWKKGKYARCLNSMKKEMDQVQVMLHQLMFFDSRMEREVLIYPDCRKHSIIQTFRSTTSAIDKLGEFNKLLKKLMGIHTKNSIG